MSALSVDISYDLVNGIVSLLEGGLSCPVYKSIPKTPEALYVHVHNVMHTEDGTKDSFEYYGTVTVEVVDESGHRADLKAAQTVLASIRALLKPSKAGVFSIGSSLTLIVFSHSSFYPFTEQADNGITRVRLIDIYNFIIG